MLNEGLVGAQSLSGDGGITKMRMGRQGDLQMSELHGRYYEQTYRGNMYWAATAAVATTTVGLATTYTGLVVSNPITSTVNLVMNKATVMQSVIQSVQVEAYALAVGSNTATNVTHTTALTVRSSKFGSGLTGQALADISATLPTAPFYYAFVHDTATATQNGTGAQIDLEGSMILVPGSYILWVTPAQASVAGLWFSFQWEEVPV